MKREDNPNRKLIELIEILRDSCSETLKSGRNKDRRQWAQAQRSAYNRVLILLETPPSEIEQIVVDHIKPLPIRVSPEDPRPGQDQCSIQSTVLVKIEPIKTLDEREAPLYESVHP